MDVLMTARTPAIALRGRAVAPIRPDPEGLKLETVMQPRDAFFAPVEQVPVAEAAGRIAAEMVSPCPPGVPVLAPGELISEDALDYLRSGKAAGLLRWSQWSQYSSEARVPKDWLAAHPEAPFSFATDGVEAAIARAQELAGGRVVSVTGGTIARQCLDLGLLDEVAVDLVPVVMGEGNRPFFGPLSSDQVLLGNPTTCVQGDQVIHLVFPVQR